MRHSPGLALSSGSGTVDSTIARLAVPPEERSRSVAYEMLGGLAAAAAQIRSLLAWPGPIHRFGLERGVLSAD